MNDESEKPGKRPTHESLGYHEGSDGKLHYTKVGPGWETPKGDIKLKLHAHPVNGNLIVRRVEDRLDAKRNGGEREERQDRRERRSSRDDRYER